MDIQIREYQPTDIQQVIKFMEELQDYLVGVDHKKRTRRLPGYGESYTHRLLKKIEENEGIIYLAQHGDTAIGLIAAILYKQTEEDLLEIVPTRDGRIQELVVDPEYRGRHVGLMLMKKAEEYLRKRGCEISRVEVFGPNVKARNFYRKLGYEDRVIDMMKEL
jgi:ribosomal protein S18 acetylase RimI-like enzyme